MPMSLGMSLAIDQGGAPAVAWTPASLTGLVDWWRADLGIASSSGHVTGWTSQAGRLTTWNQSSGTNTIGAVSTISGQYGITFATSAGIQDTTYIAVPQPCAVFLVFIASSATATANVFSSSSPIIQMGPYATGPGWFAYAGGSIIHGGATDLNPHAMIGSFNGVSSALYLDNSSVALASGSAGANGIGTNPFLGFNASFAGVVAELIFTNVQPGLADRANFYAYAHTRYGFAAS